MPTFSTQITLNAFPLYQLKFGLFGRFFNKIYIQKNYKTGMDSLHAGLKSFIEEGP